MGREQTGRIDFKRSVGETRSTIDSKCCFFRVDQMRATTLVAGVAAVAWLGATAWMLAAATRPHSEPPTGRPLARTPPPLCRTASSLEEPRGAGDRPVAFVDDRGYVCAREGLDSESRCCRSPPALRYPDAGCSADDSCCHRFVYCIARCMRDTPSLDECASRCRTSSRVPPDPLRPHCYDRRRPPPPPLPPPAIKESAEPVFARFDGLTS